VNAQSNPADHQFAGIDEKLIRANESIRNLEAEIARFFQEGEYPVLPQHNDEFLLKALEYHQQRLIPPRFSVLAGEIIHHLRSCLDHIVWHFSTSTYRVKHIRQIQFPVFKKRPVNEKSAERYKGKVEGITNTAVLSLIEGLQPYNAPDPIESPIFIIHDMDIIDKHRELVLCVPTGLLELPMEIGRIVESYKSAHPESTPAELTLKFQSYGNLLPRISFKNFGRRTIQPVVPGLIELFNYTVNTIKAFAEM
jgi:hypothetical protein